MEEEDSQVDESLADEEDTQSAEWSEEEEKTLVCNFMYAIDLPVTRGVRSLAGPVSLQVQSQGAKRSAAQRQPLATSSKPSAPPSITSMAYCPTKRRLYYGLSTGELFFWPLSDLGPGTNRYVGSHKGPISCICIPPVRGPERSGLADAGLFLSGSVAGDVKIWDYQGKVMLDPTVLAQTLHGHSGTITSLVVYADIILSSSTDGTVRSWRAVEGREQLLYPWFDLQAVVASVGGWARSMTFDRSQEVGDIGTCFVSDEEGSVTRIVPIPPSTTIENDSCTHQRLSFKIDNELPKGLSSISSKGTSSAIPSLHDHGVALIRFVGDWRLLLALCYDCCLRAYSTETGECKFVQANENRCMFSALEVDTKNGEVFAVDKLGCLFIYCMNTGEMIASKKFGKDPIVSICSVLNRECYAVATASGVSVWRIHHEQNYSKLRGGHSRAVIALHACTGETGIFGGAAGLQNEPDHRVLSASTDGTVRVWDPKDMSCSRVLDHDLSEISAMAFHESKDVMITGHDNGDVHIWDMNSGSPSPPLRQHKNTVTAVRLQLMRRSEDMLFTTGYDGMVVVWDVVSIKTQAPHMIAKFRVTRSSSLNPALSSLNPALSLTHQFSGLPPSTGEHLSGNDAQPALQQSTPRPMDPILAALRHEPEVLAVTFEAQKKVVITGGNDKLIRVWKLSGRYLGQHEGHTDAVTCLALDANFLFSGSEDCTIRVWDAAPSINSSTPSTPANYFDVGGGFSNAALPQQQLDQSQQHPHVGFTSTPLKVLFGHTRCVTALVAHPNTGHLFSCSLDGSLRIWDYVKGFMLCKHVHHEELKCMALRSDCAEVIVGTKQASILRYSSSVDATVQAQKDAETTGDPNSDAKAVLLPMAKGAFNPMHEEKERAKREALGAKWKYGAAKMSLFTNDASKS